MSDSTHTPLNFHFGRGIDIDRTPLSVTLEETRQTLRQLDMLERAGYVFPDLSVPEEARKLLREIEAAILNDPNYRPAFERPVSDSATVFSLHSAKEN